MLINVSTDNVYIYCPDTRVGMSSTLKQTHMMHFRHCLHIECIVCSGYYATSLSYQAEYMYYIDHFSIT